MAITRTAMVDDDGSGTTGTVMNNAWKQEFYDQIDAYVGTSGALKGTWTPVITSNDVSESGQAYAMQEGLWVKLGPVVHAWFRVGLSNKGTFPASNVFIAGFPSYPPESGVGKISLFSCGLIAFHDIAVAINLLFGGTQFMGVGKYQNQATINLFYNTAPATSILAAPLPTSAVTNTTIFLGATVYRTTG